MPRIAEFDFTGAPPAQGGGIQDHVTPGDYYLKVVDVVDGAAKSSGNRMITATFEIARGPEMGKKQVDRFVFVEGSKNGLQRFHAFLLALGLPVKEQKTKIDFDKLAGKICLAKIRDEKMEATEQYPDERITSRIDRYVLPGEGQPAPTEPEAPAAIAPTPEPTQSSEPAAPAPAPDVPPATENLSEEVDDLFASIP